MDSVQAASQVTSQAAAQAADITAQAAGAAASKADAISQGGADGDFDRILERAERRREEMKREWGAREAERAKELRSEAEKAARRKGESKADAEAEARKAAEEGKDAAKGEDGEAETPYAFKAERPRGRGFAFARIEAETTFPGGFKSKVSGELLLTGSLEKGAEGVSFGKGSPAGMLLGALQGMGSNLDLYKLGPEAAEALQNVLLASGMDAEQVSELASRLFGEGKADMNSVMRALAGGVDASVAAQGPLGGLVATPDGLNSLGQFLLGLGLSAEAVKSVTSGVAPGSILPAATLRTLISGGISAESLSPAIGEGDLGYLALALQSMGAGPEAADGISLMLEMKGGAVSVGDLLSFLETLEKPADPSLVQLSPKQAAKEIQTVLQNLKSDAELVKAPVFNEIILKLSMLGDRQMDRGFYELSPALQALRGGLGQAAGGDGGRPFEDGGGDSKGGRREREERRLMASQAAASRASAAGGASSAMSGAFAAGMEDGAAGAASRETLVRELKEKLVYSARRGVRRLKMSLSPESLGGLDIELKVKGDKVTANIKADSLEAYKALEGEVKTLRDELAAEGLELKLTVSFDGGGDSSPGGSFYAKDGSRYDLNGSWSGRGNGGGDGGDGEGEGEGGGGGFGAAGISPPDAAGTPEDQGTYAGSLLQAVV
ncbi:MAG: flagellar hook-length control protein FliK [Deltaproteobacteria bacterium]|jgi:hypothetical protein|nr:flagellar hook-length control protein FliK [Deltaproteobacteria bacterium]